MYKIVFYVPVSHVQQVKDAVFAAGAGSIGNYEQCCWQVLGKGQFRPTLGSTPYIGEQDSLTVVDEYRVELVCAEVYLDKAVSALKAAHPYEEAAIDIWRLHQV